MRIAETQLFAVATGNRQETDREPNWLREIVIKEIETALEKYQQGMALVKFCQEKLTEVEQKVKILDTDTDSLKDFNIV